MWGVCEKQPLRGQFLGPQNIFLGEDIRKQLPSESALFDQVNNNWKSIMDRLSKDSNALESTHHPGLSGSVASCPDRGFVAADGLGGGRDTYTQKGWLVVVECGEESGSEVWRWAPRVGTLRRRVLSGGCGGLLCFALGQPSGFSFSHEPWGHVLKSHNFSYSDKMFVGGYAELRDSMHLSEKMLRSWAELHFGTVCK